MGRRSVSPYISAVFGGKAIELAGRVIRPSYQGQGIGSTMLKEFIDQVPTEILTTYTRNPAVLNMISHVASTPYPLVADDHLREIARMMPHATIDQDGVAYHFNRYDEGGLFIGFDPADDSIENDGPNLKTQFNQLHNVRHALVVAAEVRENHQ